MHQMGKQVFLGDDKVPPVETLRLPPIHYSQDRPLPSGQVFRYGRTVLAAGNYRVHSPVLEQTCYTPTRRERIKPDVLLEAGGVSIAVEICVWNPVSPLKRQKLTGYDRPVLQICLPRDAGWEKAAVRKLVSEAAERYWVHIPKNEAFNREFEEKYDAERLALKPVQPKPVQDQALGAHAANRPSRRFDQFQDDRIKPQIEHREAFQDRREDGDPLVDFGQRLVSRLQGRWVISLPNGKYLGHDLMGVDSPIYARHFHGETEEFKDLARSQGGRLIRLGEAIRKTDKQNPSALYARYFSRKKPVGPF